MVLFKQASSEMHDSVPERQVAEKIVRKKVNVKKNLTI
jgi:hypothetical protein